MYINIAAFEKLLQERFENNLHQCARALNLDPSTICRVVNKSSSAGAKFLSNFIEYCTANGLDYNQYIFLSKPLRGTNKDIEDSSA